LLYFNPVRCGKSVGIRNVCDICGKTAYEINPEVKQWHRKGLMWAHLRKEHVGPLPLIKMHKGNK
jgi:hypothetical protein